MRSRTLGGRIGHVPSTDDTAGRPEGVQEPGGRARRSKVCAGPSRRVACPVLCCSDQQILGERRHTVRIATELAGLCACPTLGGSVISQRAVVSGGAMAVPGLLSLLPAAFAARWTP